MASAISASARHARSKVSWLDLRGSGLSAIERLCLEEALLRHDPEQRSWAVVGTHEPTSHRYLRSTDVPSHVTASDDPNKTCLIVMGIGGKPKELLNLDLVRRDGVLVIKRFSGGGTVVLDHPSIWTTFIGRTHHFPHVPPYPRDIMKWSANEVFDLTFSNLKQQSLQRIETGTGQVSSTNRTSMIMEKESGHLKRHQQQQQQSLVMDTKSCGMENSGRTVQVPLAAGNSRSNIHNGRTTTAAIEIPDFSLRENDYVLGDKKMGGNAQSIVKGGWLHHTSFLWDYVDEHMEYLSLPRKRPDYRGDRSHDDFLVKLSQQYGQRGTRPFFTSMKAACGENFELDKVSLQEALNIVNDQVGGLQTFFDNKSRTRLIELE